MLHSKVFVRESVSVNGLTSGSISSSNITALNHKMRNDTMENRSLVMQRHSALSDSLLSGAQSTEVFNSSRGRSSKSTVKTKDNTKQAHNNSTDPLAIYLNIKVHSLRNLRLSLLYITVNYVDSPFL